MKPKLLLHICCAPCSTHVIEKLQGEFEVEGFFYNPNLFPREEYEKRLKEAKRICNEYGIKLHFCKDQGKKNWLRCISGLENEPEGAGRCKKCYEYRLRKTARQAKKMDINIIATTLTISPHKNVAVINEVGIKITDEYGLKFLEEDFKKQDGYKHSIELSKKHNLYRQNYCGCEFSK